MVNQNLQGIAETLLITLWARAVEARHPNPIIKDYYAVDIMKRIGYDFSKFDKTWMSQVGVVVRTELFDKAAKEFINKYPDAVIINIGCGLDTRFFRLDNGKIHWYDLDLPEVISVRKQFINETDRCTMISKSVFDYSWLGEIAKTDRPILIIAEGILMYFTEQEVRSLIDKFVAEFPDAEMLFDIITPALVKRSKQHDTVSKMNADFQWGIKSGKEIEKYNSRIKFLGEWNYFDYHKKRWKWMRWLALIPAFKKRFSSLIVHLEFVNKRENPKNIQ